MKKNNLLGHFAVNENKISLLYSAYANQFPKYADFWNRLAKDEKRHSALLSDIDNRFGGECDSWKASENAPLILDYIGRFLDDCLLQAQSSVLSFKEAISNALSLEQSMIEKNNFDIFSTDNSEVNAVLEKLNRETEGHRLSLEKYLDTGVWLDD